MIKRTLYFGNPAYLSTKDAQMRIKFSDSEKPEAKVPIEDIGVVILDHYQITITHTLITRLLSNNVALITCDEKHMPQGLMLNLDGNTLQQQRFTHQIEASLPLKKNLWQQTIKAKIRNQAAVLRFVASKALTLSKDLVNTDHVTLKLDNMQYWEDSVASGDPDNYEARAAAFYWKTVFTDYIKSFKRGRYEPEPNNLLNYGYAMLRAITARSLVASGLMPTMGIHHHNKYNAYCLADDVMEPYRPFVDMIVLEILENFEDVEELTPILKQELLQIPVVDVIINGQSSPLMIAMQQTTASLADCFAGHSRKMKYPTIK